jgi:hypothetical protein
MYGCSFRRIVVPQVNLRHLEGNYPGIIQVCSSSIPPFLISKSSNWISLFYDITRR